MEKVRLLTQNGQELTQTAYNQDANLAAAALDTAVQELFRPGTAYSTIQRGVIPYGVTGDDSTNPVTAGIVTSSGLSNAKVAILPFRAVIGPRDDATPLAAWREARSVACVPAAGSDLATQLTLTATSTNNRIDLVYVKVTLGAATTTASNYVRDPSTGDITNPTLTLEEGDTFQIGVIPGSEGASPTAPTITADSGSDYYIPLAYVYLTHPFTGITQVQNHLIREAAPVLSQHQATGVATMRPCTMNGSYGSPVTANQFSLAGRTDSYLPPTMVGTESRLIALQFDRATKVPALNATTIVDDSIDWRNRIFHWTAIAKASGGGTGVFAWGKEGAASGAGAGGPTPIYTDHTAANLGSKMQIGMGQSFYADAVAGRGVANLANANLSQMTAGSVFLYVDSVGRLKVDVGAANPACNILIWLTATGPFPNAN